MKHKHNLVAFIGIGVQKSATTWMYSMLTSHPEIKGAKGGLKNKEVNFFNRSYFLGFDWYNNKFEFGDHIVGEFSTLYFPECSVPERVYKYNPDIKLILIVRNPIDRAFSQHKFQFMKNRLSEKSKDFDCALEINPSYIDQGLYAKHLANWLNFFTLKQILIITFDDIKDNCGNELKKAYKFLGVDENYVPDAIQSKVNASYHVKSRLLNRAYSGIARRLPDVVVKIFKKTGLTSIVRRANRKKISDEVIKPMTTETRHNLNTIFKDDIVDFESMISRDLSQLK